MARHPPEADWRSKGTFGTSQGTLPRLDTAAECIDDEGGRMVMGCHFSSVGPPILGRGSLRSLCRPLPAADADTFSRLRGSHRGGLLPGRMGKEAAAVSSCPAVATRTLLEILSNVSISIAGMASPWALSTACVVSTTGTQVLAYSVPDQWPSQQARWHTFRVQEGMWTEVNEVKYLRSDQYELCRCSIATANALAVGSSSRWRLGGWTSRVRDAEASWENELGASILWEIVDSQRGPQLGPGGQVCGVPDKTGTSPQ
eukprot:s3228_g2.t1